MNELINGGLRITLPDGFREMSVDEIRQGYGTSIENTRGFWDKGRHVIVSVSWNETNKLLVKLAEAKSIAKRTKRDLARLNKNNEYRDGGLFSAHVAGQDTWGVKYGYTVQGVAHDAEAVVLLGGKCCYIVNYYNHSDDSKSNEPLHDEVFSSLAFA